MGKISALLAAKPRKMVTVDLADVLGLPAPAPALVRIALSGEDIAASVAGLAHVDKVAKPLAPEAAAATRADAELLQDARARAAIAVAFRDPDDPSKPIFPSEEWLLEHTSTEELGALVNVLAEARRASSRSSVPDETSVGIVIDVVGRLADQGHEAPGVALAPYPREILTFLFVEVVAKLRDARATIAALEADLEEARAVALGSPVDPTASTETDAISPA